FASNSATESRNRNSSPSPTVTPAYQNIGVFFVRTTVAIWSVTEPKLYPGAMISRGGGVFSITSGLSAMEEALFLAQRRRDTEKTLCCLLRFFLRVSVSLRQNLPLFTLQSIGHGRSPVPGAEA